MTRIKDWFKRDSFLFLWNKDFSNKKFLENGSVEGRVGGDGLVYVFDEKILKSFKGLT